MGSNDKAGHKCRTSSNSALATGSPISAEESILRAIESLGDALIANEKNQTFAAKVYINAARSYLNGAEELLFKSR